MSKWVVLTQANCEWCQKAIQMLADNGQTAQIISIDDQGGTKLRQFLKAIDISTVPAIWNYGHYVGGYDDLRHFMYGWGLEVDDG